MIPNTQYSQKGMIDWKWILVGAAALMAFFAYWRYGTRLERAGPSQAALIEPAAGALLDADDPVTQLVWKHNESDATHRSNMQFVVCVLDSGEDCIFPIGLPSPALRRWEVSAPNLSVSNAPPPASNRQYVFDIPGSDSLPTDTNGTVLRWSVVACWPNMPNRCAGATPAEFTVAGPNLRAASPSGLFSSSTGTFTFSVRAENTSNQSSGSFDYLYRYARVAVNSTGQRILDFNAPEVQPNPRYITRNGNVYAATAAVDPNTVHGILLPGTDISAPTTGTANIPSTAGGNPQVLDGMSITVTVPAGIAIFLWLDPDNDRIESDESDNFRSQLETAL